MKKTNPAYTVRGQRKFFLRNSLLNIAENCAAVKTGSEQNYFLFVVPAEAALNLFSTRPAFAPVVPQARGSAGELERL